MKLATLVLVGTLIGSLLYAIPQAQVGLLSENSDFSIYLVALTLDTMVTFYLVFVGPSGMHIECLGTAKR